MVASTDRMRARKLDKNDYTARNFLLSGGTEYPATGDNTIRRRTGTVQVTEDSTLTGWKFRRAWKNSNSTVFPWWLDLGAPFVSVKLEANPLDPRWIRAGLNNTYCSVYPSTEAYHAGNAGWPADENESAIRTQLFSTNPSAFMSPSDMDALGATAISRVAPTNPLSEGATFVAEIISERKFFAIPGSSLRKERNYRGASGEYLNYQLGIAPLIGGLSEFHAASLKAEEALEQLSRDSGRMIRRGYEFPDVETDTTDVVGGVFPHPDIGLVSKQVSTGTRTTRRRVRKQIWFSGAFTYYLPDKGGLMRSIRELDQVYGVVPGLDTGWELVPFSFVADYFVNLGDVFKNMNSLIQDGLILRYGYMMVTTTVHTHTEWYGPLALNGTKVNTRIAHDYIYTVKQRRPANPFGFGVSDNQLTGRQTSILAALTAVLAKRKK